MYATFWALLPPIIAILLALITKEVYSSLFIGIVVGGLFSANYNPEKTMNNVVQDGFVKVLSDPSHIGIIIFLIILGTLVCMMNQVGGSVAFGRWAKKHIKTRIGAELATVALGVMIFIDDYFNCLTVGSVMRPVALRHNVSREKLAYIIDATAAPICIIAPVSSWAAAVAGNVPEDEEGFSIFLRAIPYNYYALFTLAFMIGVIVLRVDFGGMKKFEKLACEISPEIDDEENSNDALHRGGVIDLVFPVIVLIICCVIGMIYSGGFFSGKSFIKAFGDSDASVGLVLGSLGALIVTIVFYLVRRVIKFKDCMDCLPKGFQAMVPAILILSFAWTLKEMTDKLGAAIYVEQLVKNHAAGFASLLPAVIFVIAALLAFSTGTSWGTFGILIPIVVNVFKDDSNLMIIAISACMAGAVCGDHCSPISDTTIMASAGAECNHVNHVSTQLPYAILVAVISCLTYVVAGLSKNVFIPLVFGFALTVGVLFLIKWLSKNEEPDVIEAEK